MYMFKLILLLRKTPYPLTTLITIIIAKISLKNALILVLSSNTHICLVMLVDKFR